MLKKTPPKSFPYPDVSRRLLMEHLTFEYVEGNRARFFGPVTTNRRVLPFFIAVRLRGPWRLSIGDGRATAQVGGACLVGAGVPHEFFGEAGETFDACWVHARFELFGSLELTASTPLTMIPEGPVARAAGRLIEAINTGMSDPAVPAASGAARALANAFELLDLFSGPMALQANLTPRLRHAERLAPALRYIRAHAARDIHRDDIADAAHLSATRLHAIFLEAVGETPMAFVNRERMTRARALLVTTDLPIKTIAHRVSPFDAFHFSRVFRAQFGVSPRAYRSAHHSGLVRAL